MNIKKSIFFSILGLSTGLIIIISYLNLTNTNSDAAASFNSNQQIQELVQISSGLTEVKKNEINATLMSKVKFSNKISLPKELPFKSYRQFVETISLNENTKDEFFVVHYFDESADSSIVISITDANVIPSDEEIKEIKMNNGEIIQFLDNGVSQLAFFNKDGLFYEIQGKKDHKNQKVHYKVDDFIKVIESMN